MQEQYISTRGGQKNISASAGIIAGLSNDGGLFVPSFIHDIHLDIKKLANLSYYDLAKTIFSYFLNDFSESQIDACVANAYQTGLFRSKDSPVKVTTLKDRSFLELYHGPTCAFKDLALTILPHLMKTSMAIQGIHKEIIILTATSGDTGKAALSGFANIPNINIIVYYPKDGVSTIQEKQMITQEGSNTRVIGVNGNFDDTQNGVKLIFNNLDIINYLDKQGYCLSSANSINIGRLLPQIIYYFYSYFELVRNHTIALGNKINFVVPTGNFGNILAGYYASIIGLPVHRFICASNSNNVLTDFFHTGEYNRNRTFYKTISPSMDILISSNLERFIFDLTENNVDQTRKWMIELSETGKYHLPDELTHKAAELFSAGYADETETSETIKDMFVSNHYLIDPHTAVASRVYDNYIKQTGDSTPTIILSTASPYKFGRSVYQSIFGSIPKDLNDFTILDDLAEKTNTTIPKPLKDLDKKPTLHNFTCEKDKMENTVFDFVKDRKAAK